MNRDRPRLPAGRPPWDTLNGFRVGAFAGGILGALVMLVAGRSAFWVVLVGAAVGGAVGYWVERRKRVATGDDGAGGG